jgi:uncharacterized membrane protein
MNANLRIFLTICVSLLPIVVFQIILYLWGDTPFVMFSTASGTPLTTAILSGAYYTLIFWGYTWDTRRSNDELRIIDRELP